MAFDYEDRAEVVMQRVKHARSWSTLVPYIGWMIKLLKPLGTAAAGNNNNNNNNTNNKNNDKNNNTNNKNKNKNNDDCLDLIGICYQIRALVHLRMATSFQDQTSKLYAQKKYEEMGVCTSKLISSHDESVQDFKRGMRDLSLETIKREYPKTWSARQTVVQPVSSHEGGYRPLEDPYYLPLHAFSSVQEAAALGYAITKEWADRRGIVCDWALVRGLA